MKNYNEIFNSIHKTGNCGGIKTAFFANSNDVCFVVSSIDDEGWTVSHIVRFYCSRGKYTECIVEELDYFGVPIDEQTLYVYGDHGECLKEINASGDLNYFDPEFIYANDEKANLLTDMVAIGNDIIAVGILRVVTYKKMGKKWQDISIGYKEKEKHNNREAILETFEYVDAFSIDDIYAAGRQEFWHYDGNSWEPIELPVLSIDALLCAGNGKVYIASGNYLLEGRRHVWKTIKIENVPSGCISAMTWYRDELILCGNNFLYGIIKYDGDKFSQFEMSHFKLNLDKEVLINIPESYLEHNGKSGVHSPSSPHTLCSNGDFLLCAGSDSVILYDGKLWHTIFNVEMTEEELRATGTFYDPREL